MTDPFSFADGLGPAKIIHVHEPGCQLKGVLVVDNVAAGPSIGGLRMASELIRPTVVSFLDTMLRDRDLNLRIDEVRIPESSHAVGTPLNQLGLDKTPHALLIATRTADGEWVYNPPRAKPVEPGTTLIFLGSPSDSRALCEMLDGEMIAVPSTDS